MENESQVQRSSVPVSLAERPLNKGMIRHLPSQMLHPGSLLEASNVRVTTKGIKRRNGIARYTQGNVEYGPIDDIIPFWKTDGIQQTVLLDQKHLYLVSNLALTPIYNTFTTGTCAVSTNTVTFTGAPDMNTVDVRPGDLILLDPDLGTEEVRTVESITGIDSLTVTEAFTGTFTAGSTFEIRRVFQHAVPHFLDTTQNGQVLYIADSVRGLWVWDGETLTVGDQVGDYSPGCVTYFNDRIFIGRTIEEGTTKRQRIRWSGIGFAQHLNFPAQNFLDLPYTRGELLCLEPFGNMLVAYFSDAVFIGQATNNPNLPVQFDQVETGGIGLVGMKAVTKWLDGHYFVGQDDIYFLSNRGIERIGTPIAELIFKEGQRLDNVYAATDPGSTRVVFAFSENGEDLNKLYSFDYNAQAWSYNNILMESLSAVGLIRTAVWDDMTAAGILEENQWTPAAFVNYPTWSSIASRVIPKTDLFFGRSGTLYRQETDAASDAENAINIEIITRDEDYGNPDHNKIWTRFTMKLEEPVSVELNFNVDVSVNRGRTWKNLGVLRIPEGYDEGKVDFRVVGQLTRFRLRSNNLIEPYIITEFVRRASGQGLEVPSRGPAAGS